MIFVEVINKQRKEKIEKKELVLLEKAMQIAGEVLQLNGDFEVSVALVGEKKIKDLNREYRNKNKVTDVLSFALEDSAFWQDIIKCKKRTKERYLLGDIVICMSRVILQAKEFCHTREREMVYLAVHGILHLIGFDHENKEDKVKMREKEREIMKMMTKIPGFHQ